ncbi:hypothetical protein FRB99_002634, partial [Tulasnella sp. 403]
MEDARASLPEATRVVFDSTLKKIGVLKEGFARALTIIFFKFKGYSTATVEVNPVIGPVEHMPDWHLAVIARIFN